MEMHDSRPVDYRWHIMMMKLFRVKCFVTVLEKVSVKGDATLVIPAETDPNTTKLLHGYSLLLMICKRFARNF